MSFFQFIRHNNILREKKNNNFNYLEGITAQAFKECESMSFITTALILAMKQQ